MTVAQRLLTLMLRSPELDPRIQRRILHEGTRERDTDLLIGLARYPALDPDVDAALGETALASVRAAWVARPGRTLEDVSALIDSEKRVTVLAAIVETPGVPEQAIEAAASKLSAATLLPVLGREDLSLELRARLACLFAEKVNPRTRLTGAQLASVPTNPELVRSILGSTVHVGLAAHCLTLVDATEEDLGRIVELAIADLDPQREDEVRPVQEWIHLIVQGLSGHVITETQRDRLRKALEGAACSRWERERAIINLNQRTPSNVSREAALAAIKKCTTPEEVANIIRTVTLHRLPILPFAQAAYTLPNVSAEGFRVMLDSASLDWRDARVLWTYQADPVKTALLYSKYPWLDFSVVEKGEHGADTVAALVRMHAEESKPLPQAVQHSKHLTGELLVALPVSALVLLDEDAAVKVSGALADRLVEAATDDTQWATLRVLADEFEGTLPELLDTARAL